MASHRVKMLQTKGRSKMPRQSKTTKDKGGPFLAAAIFCDNILEDKDSTLSVMRIVDGCNITLRPDAPKGIPSKQHPIPVSQTCLLTFRTGHAPGKYELSIVIETPDGTQLPPTVQTLVLKPPANGGANVKLQITFAVEQVGIYWFNVSIDGKLKTRMPFGVKVHRTETVPATKK